MPVDRQILQTRLEQAFPDSDIKLNALVGDNDHWQVDIASSVFNGISRLAQHRMVTDAVKDLNIHALSIKTATK